MKSTSIFLVLLLSFSSLLAQGPIKFEADRSQLERLKKINPDFNKILPEDIIEYGKSRRHPNMKNISDWEELGPNIITSSTGINFFVSGRARSVEFVNDGIIRIGTASGGLWEANVVADDTIIRNISEHQVPSPWIGAMATSPFDPNIIIVGTGEPSIKYGAGVWRTEDGGTTWNEAKLPTFSGSFHDVVFSKIKDKVWLTGEGAYYSRDNGLTWVDTKRWNITGIAIDHFHPDTLMVGQFATGIFKSYDGGKN